MSLDSFFDVVYEFYPKGIDCLVDMERYASSKEYLKLKNKIKWCAESPRKEGLEMFLSQFKKVGKEMKFYDATLFRWQDRCFTFELSERQGKITNKIRFHISVLIPYFVINYFKIERYDDKSIYTLLSYDDVR